MEDLKLNCKQCDFPTIKWVRSVRANEVKVSSKEKFVDHFNRLTNFF